MLIVGPPVAMHHQGCLLYTSDAADERSSVDLGGRRIIQNKKKKQTIKKKKYKYGMLAITAVPPQVYNTR